MSKTMVKYIRLGFGIVLSLLLIIVGVLLMIACVNIYKIGPRPFTPENISSAFAKIAVPVWITVGAVVVGVILMPFLPTEKSKTKAIKDKKLTLFLLLNKLDTEACDADTRAALKKEQQTRKGLFIAATILCVAVTIPAILYCLNLDHFSADYNASVISACLYILPCSFVAMGICIALVYIENINIERQLKLTKTALAQPSSKSSRGTVKEHQSHTKVIVGIRIALAIIALILIIAGICNGGMADVLSKAINICTECIGLG